MEEPLTTERHALAQVVICKGCCCGEANNGRPPVPDEHLKSIWKKERLLKTVLLISTQGQVMRCRKSPLLHSARIVVLVVVPNRLGFQITLQLELA
jgi:hypothetical protein